MHDQQIIEYVLSRVEEENSRTPESANFRNRMLTPFVVLLREEGGLSWNDISDELGISKYAATRAYEAVGGDTS